MVTKDNENVSEWPLRIGSNKEMTNGWPLGLRNMNMTLSIVADRNQYVVVAEPDYQRMPSHSFSSFSSSNFDTESTISFCPDQSVSLGRLMGIKPAWNRRRVFQTKTNHFDEHQNNVFHSSSYTKEQEQPPKLCVPLLHNVIQKLITRSKSLQNVFFPTN